MSAAACKGASATVNAADAAGPMRPAEPNGPLTAMKATCRGQSGELCNPSAAKAPPLRGFMPSVALSAVPAYDAGANAPLSLVAAVGADMDTVLNPAAFETSAGTNCGPRPVELVAAATASNQHAGAMNGVT